MLSGDFFHNTVKSISPRPSPPKEHVINNENTLDFINLSLNKADQRRKIAYHPEGISKSKDEEKRHRELVYETKKKYIESLKKVEEEKNASKSTSGMLRDKIKRDRDDKLIIWEKVFEQNLSNFDKIIKNMHRDSSSNNSKGEGNSNANSDAVEFRKFWIQGVPEKIRAKVWARVTGNPNFITPQLFEILWKRGMRLKDNLERQEVLDNCDITNQSSGQTRDNKPEMTEEIVESIKQELYDVNKDIDSTKEMIENLDQSSENSKDTLKVKLESTNKQKLDEASKKLVSLAKQRFEISSKLDAALYYTKGYSFKIILKYN